MESLPPAKFVQDRSGSHGMTLNSLVSGGALSPGRWWCSRMLFPRVRVNSFCNIDSAVLLPDVWVGRSCRLRRCVIDRACVIPEGMVIGENAEEDARRFYRSEEGIVLVTRDMLREIRAQTGALMQVLHVCSEMFPLLKTGGLADVIGALPAAQIAEGIDTRVLLPAFPGYPSRRGGCQVVTRRDTFAGRITLLYGHFNGVGIYLIDAPHLYDCPGSPYHDTNQHAYPDNVLRFALLGWVGSEWPADWIRSGARMWCMPMTGTPA